MHLNKAYTSDLCTLSWNVVKFATWHPKPISCASIADNPLDELKVPRHVFEASDVFRKWCQETVKDASPKLEKYCYDICLNCYLPLPKDSTEQEQIKLEM